MVFPFDCAPDESEASARCAHQDTTGRHLWIADVNATGAGRSGNDFSSSIHCRIGMHSSLPDLVASLATSLHPNPRVVDVQGREVARLLDGPVPVGERVVSWNMKSDRLGIHSLVMELDGNRVWTESFVAGR